MLCPKCNTENQAGGCTIFNFINMLHRIKLRWFYILLVLLTVFFFSPGHIFADMIPPQPGNNCSDEEWYFRANTIKTQTYKHVREVVYNDPNAARTDPKLNEKGYCVSTAEYCSKNKCDLETKLFLTIRSTSFLGLQIKILIYNFVINSFVALVLLLVFKKNLSKSLSNFFFPARLAIITLLGYLSDLIGIVVAAFSTERCKYISSWMCGNIHIHDLGFASLLSSPIGIIETSISVFFLVSMVFYHVFSRTAFREKRTQVTTSLIFGLLSNPFWFIIFKIFF